jgi:hypothetical protein
MFKISLILFILFTSANSVSQTECPCLGKSLKQYFIEAKVVLWGEVKGENVIEVDPITKQATKSLLLFPEQKVNNLRPSKLFTLTIKHLYKTSSKINLQPDDQLSINIERKEGCQVRLEEKADYIFYINKIIDRTIYLNACHKFYTITKESVNSKDHITLLEMSKKKDEKTKMPVQVTPKREPRKFNAGRFQDKLRGHHKEDDSELEN